MSIAAKMLVAVMADAAGVAVTLGRVVLAVLIKAILAEGPATVVTIGWEVTTPDNSREVTTDCEETISIDSHGMLESLYAESELACCDRQH